MLRIAIDGASRGNGKPTCVAAGAAFIQWWDNGEMTDTDYISRTECGSTSQRAELLALLIALKHVRASGQDAQIITDSEYLFNTMTKEWYRNWENKGWVTATGEPVKNRDLWEQITNVYLRCDGEINFYYIKGHCIPFGKVTAMHLLTEDPTGKWLYKEVDKKYDALKDFKSEQIDKARLLSERNNGFIPEDAELKAFIVSNTVADIMATICVEDIDVLG